MQSQFYSQGASASMIIDDIRNHFWVINWAIPIHTNAMAQSIIDWAIAHPPHSPSTHTYMLLRV